MASLKDIEGIGSKYVAKLKDAGIATTDSLLKAGSTPKGRKDIAERSGISDKLILEWVNHADLFRIKGVASEYADLIEAAGVDTVIELSKRVPANLHAKMTEINQAKKLVRSMPSVEQVVKWVSQAKKLPRAVKY